MRFTLIFLLASAVEAARRGSDTKPIHHNPDMLPYGWGMHNIESLSEQVETEKVKPVKRVVKKPEKKVESSNPGWFFGVKVDKDHPLFEDVDDLDGME